MSRWRIAFVVAAAALLALALARRGEGAGVGGELSGQPAVSPPCLACAGVHAPRPVVVVDGPDTETVLASLGYQVVAPQSAEAAGSTAVQATGGDEGWTRPIVVARVRRLSVARIAPAGGTAQPTATATAAPSDAATRGDSTAASTSSADVAVPVGPSVAGAERLVRDGVVLIDPGSLCGTPIHAADGKVRVTNISSGPYSVMFLDPVKVDGLTIPASTELPVAGQLEIEIARDSHMIILPHASAWPTTPAPTGDG